MREKPVAIVGGGLAGLVAARELRTARVPFRLFEAAPQLGGLARTERDPEGFSFDFGAHFITNRLADELDASHLCRDVRHYGEAVVADRGIYSFPFGFAKDPRLLASVAAAKLKSSTTPVNAADQMRIMYGDTFANEIAIPLVEGWSGVSAKRLSSAVAEKMDEGLIKTAWLKTAGLLTRRAVTIGYTREKPSSAKVWHVYPEGGVGVLIEHLAQDVSESVELEAPVEAILVEGGKVKGVVVGDKEIEVSAAMSTAPVHVLSRLVRGTQELDYLARFQYRPMVFVNLLLEGRGLIPDVVTWFTDSALPFFRLTEAPISMPWLAPQGKTSLMADYAVNTGDDVWSAEPEVLAEETLSAMEPVVSDIRRRYLRYRVLKTPLAYPIFLNEYEQERQRFSRSTGVEGLYSIGRNGEFAHILMEDVYWRTKRRVGELLAHRK